MGRIDTEIGWSGATISLLASIEGLLSRTVRLGIKVGIALSISLSLSIATLVALPLVQILLRTTRRGMDRIAREGAQATNRKSKSAKWENAKQRRDET